jgi:hypothetical protein
MSPRHQMAWTILWLAAAMDSLGGIMFSAVEHVSFGLGQYWALTTATTVGYGDVTAHTVAGRLVSAVVMLTVIPLFAATFSLLTAGISAGKTKEHLRSAVDDIKEHHRAELDRRLGDAPRETSRTISEIDPDRDGCGG